MQALDFIFSGKISFSQMLDGPDKIPVAPFVSSVMLPFPSSIFPRPHMSGLVFHALKTSFSAKIVVPLPLCRSVILSREVSQRACPPETLMT